MHKIKKVVFYVPSDDVIKSYFYLINGIKPFDIRLLINIIFGFLINKKESEHIISGAISGCLNSTVRYFSQVSKDKTVSFKSGSSNRNLLKNAFVTRFGNILPDNGLNLAEKIIREIEDFLKDSKTITEYKREEKIGEFILVDNELVLILC